MVVVVIIVAVSCGYSCYCGCSCGCSSSSSSSSCYCVVVDIIVIVVIPSGPLSARTERDAVLQGTAVFMSYLAVYAGFRDTMGWGGVGQ